MKPKLERIARNRWTLFVALFGLVLVILYFRYPNNVLRPNFYAEDGGLFYDNLIHKGFARSFFTPFNGYFIAGGYVIAQIGLVINWLVGNQFTNIPRVFAITADMFLAAVIALPVLLFRAKYRVRELVAVVLVTSFVPLPSWDYAILGIIGSMKFVFFYLAFLLVLYRNQVVSETKQYRANIAASDAGIVLSALTNASVLLLLPLLALPYLKQLKKPLALLQQRTVRGLAVVWGVAAAEVLYLIIHPLPKLAGYLDTPFPRRELVEVIAARTVLFPVVVSFYHSLSGRVTAGLFVLVCLLAIYLVFKKSYVLALALYASLGATLILIVTRPGVGVLYAHYQTSGPDQFFYAQNLVIGFALAVVAMQFYTRLGPEIRSLYLAGLLLLAFFSFGHAGTFGKNDFMAQSVGTIYQNSRRACALPHASTVELPMYPNNLVPLTVEATKVCKTK